MILVLIQQKNILTGNTIRQALKKMLKPISKALTFVYYLKKSNISLIIICNLYLY